MLAKVSAAIFLCLSHDCMASFIARPHASILCGGLRAVVFLPVKGTSERILSFPNTTIGKPCRCLMFVPLRAYLILKPRVKTLRTSFVQQAYSAWGCRPRRLFQVHYQLHSLKSATYHGHYISTAQTCPYNG